MSEDINKVEEFPLIKQMKSGAVVEEVSDTVPPGMYIVEIAEIKVVPAGTHSTTFKSNEEDTLDFMLKVVKPSAQAGKLLKRSFVRMTLNQGGRGFKPSMLYTIAHAAMPTWDGKELNVKKLIGMKVQISTQEKTVVSTGKKYSAITDFFPLPEGE